MQKSLRYGFAVLLLSWRANGIHSLAIIAGKLYDSTLYPFVQVFLLAKTLDVLARGTATEFTDFSWIIIAYIAATLIKLMLKSVVDVKETFLQTQLEGYIDLQICKKLTQLDPATFENHEFQNVIAQLEGIKGTLQMHLIRFTSLIDAVFKFTTATIVVSLTFPIFAPIILIASVPSYLVWDKMRISTWPFYVEKRTLFIRVTQYVKSLLSADSTSKESTIFKTGSILVGKVRKEQKTYYKNFNKANSPWALKIFIARLFQFGIFIYTQYLSLEKVLLQTLSIGQFALIFQQSLNLVFSAEEILNQYSSISARNKYIDKFFDFLSTEKTINSPEHPTPIPKLPYPATIEFKNVSFKYPKTNRYILKDFNLVIKSGEKIALVGENGAGKTTIIKLLLRFYDVTDGEILINGINISSVDLDKWHKLVGALFQDFIKYQFTFKENVYYGDIDHIDEEKLLKAALEKSGANSYVRDLPDGYNQTVGKMFEGGIDLSGGQWQKLALARAFFRDAPLLILDEPTSAIDAKAEYEIFQNVQKLQHNKTVIIISHRFSTVRNADRILVLEEGKILEQGTHEKLMKKKGLYAELFEIQAQGYK